jgi:ribosomal-protein-serine acetyltransferase
MKTSPQESPDISIVPTSVDHAAALASLVQQNIAHLRAYLPAVAQLTSVEQATMHLHAASDKASTGETLEWHLFAGATLCGSIRLKDIDTDDRKAKIGYFLGSQFEGRGIVTSSVRAVLAQAFGSLQLNRVELRCAAGNQASIGVAERLGFTLEGILRQEEFLNGVFVDHNIYGLLHADFMQANAKRLEQRNKDEKNDQTNIAPHLFDHAAGGKQRACR